jgi:hypothetical protein
MRASAGMQQRLHIDGSRSSARLVAQRTQPTRCRSQVRLNCSISVQAAPWRAGSTLQPVSRSHRPFAAACVSAAPPLHTQISTAAVAEVAAVSEGLILGRGDAAAWDCAAVGNPVVSAFGENPHAPECVVCGGRTESVQQHSCLCWGRARDTHPDRCAATWETMSSAGTCGIQAATRH